MPQFTISAPPTPPPQQFTNAATLIDGQVNTAGVLLFINRRYFPGGPALPGTGLPGQVVPGYQIPRYGRLLTNGLDYTITGGQVTMTVPPPSTSVLTAVIFPVGVALGGPTPTRYVAPWQLPLPLEGTYDGVATAYRIVFGQTIFGTCDGVNNLFTTAVTLRRGQVFVNGILQTLNSDCVLGTGMLVFLPQSLPQPGDLISMLGWPVC